MHMLSTIEGASVRITVRLLAKLNIVKNNSKLCMQVCLRVLNTALYFISLVFSSLSKNSLSLYTSLGAHQARAYPGFRSIKQLGVLLLPPGWDASPSQGYPQ